MSDLQVVGIKYACSCNRYTSANIHTHNVNDLNVDGIKYAYSSNRYTSANIDTHNVNDLQGRAQDFLRGGGGGGCYPRPLRGPPKFTVASPQFMM